MTQPLQTRRVKEALARVQNLFLDPVATLTTADAAQRAGLDRQACRALLQNLVEAGFLEQRLPGMFVRSLSALHEPSDAQPRQPGSQVSSTKGASS